MPTTACQPRFLSDVGECAVAVVLVQTRSWSLSGRPMRVQPISIGQINVQPSIMVVIEKGKSASFGLDDRPFVVNAAPHIRNRKPCLLGHIHKLDRRYRGGGN